MVSLEQCIQTSQIEPDDDMGNIDAYDGQATEITSIEKAHDLLGYELVNMPVYMWKEQMAPKWHQLPARGNYIGFCGKDPQPSRVGIPFVLMRLPCLLWNMAMIEEGLKRLNLRWKKLGQTSWYCQSGEWIESIKKPPGPVIKASARCNLLILGLMAAMAKASTIPNIDLTPDKRLSKIFRKASQQEGRWEHAS
jgi:hypothetical protein